MRVHDLPTNLIRDLSGRCSGIFAASGDRRIIYAAVNRACLEEIEARVEGLDFPLISAEAAATFAALINSGFPEFNKFLFELEK